MIEAIIIGIIQGVGEWLPISSEGMIILVKTNFFGAKNLSLLIHEALFFHIGTLLAALVYFRKDIIKLFNTLKKYRCTQNDEKQLLKFLIIATFISGVLGIVLLQIITYFEEEILFSSRIITFFIGLMLLVTAFLQLKTKSSGHRTLKDITAGDSVLLGIVQGFAVLPGLSRSGLTVAALLLKKFDGEVALRMSFLLSIPIVFLGNIILNSRIAVFTWYNIVTLFFAFLFGILTISLLLRLAKRINFGYLLLIFSFLLFTAALIS